MAKYARETAANAGERALSARMHFIANAVSLAAFETEHVMRAIVRRIEVLEARAPAARQAMRRVIVKAGEPEPAAGPDEFLIVRRLVSPPQRAGDGRDA